MGIPAHIARFCRTHAGWKSPDNTLEDLLIALADKLWEGCRNEQLENLVINKIASLIQKNFWDMFLVADSLFEKIGDRGINRLNCSL